MKHKYDIKSILEKLKEDAKQYEKDIKKCKANYRKEHNAPYPHDDYNVSQAFVEICEELQAIKDQLNAKM